jgi:hypothetical protein
MTDVRAHTADVVVVVIVIVLCYVVGEGRRG